MSGDPELLADFDRFLSQFPLLGLEHDAGRQIAEAIRNVRWRNLEPSHWFRGVEAEGSRSPAPEEFFPPDPSRVAIPEQRFNHQGQRVFYLSDSVRGAALECKESGMSGVWVQQFEVAAIQDVLDLSASTTERCLARESAMFCGEVDDSIARPEHLKPEYRVPRFVADCARRRGVRALLVPSTVEGINLVIFCWAPGALAAIGTPQQVSL